jgi:hypothetical protein
LLSENRHDINAPGGVALICSTCPAAAEDTGDGIAAADEARPCASGSAA